ncbi:ATP-dependent nuclease [Maribellus sediminis]|uniref:ATP-dependent nuclease n=1 Tax=Maribellus sediminis TaxID=2696285 RepID=UPI00142FE0BE|nr:AAA family ATPase [Maribellus sediminis]
MKFVKFDIKQYRAVSEISVELNHQIIPLIGVNESGKTSILQAILSFDKGQDRLNQGYHLEYTNRYDTMKKQECEITAHFCLNAKDYEKLFKALKTKSDNSIFDILKSHQKNKESILITRHLSKEGKPYSLDYPKVEDDILRKRIINHITTNQPYVLYFDDFTDRVPSEITFSPDYIKTGQIKGRSNKEWQFIIEEIFNRSGAEGFEESNSEKKPLQAFMNLKEKDIRDGVLYDITDVLEKEVISEWKKMKKEGLNKLADDSDKLELLINYDEQNYTFEFKVRDKSKEGKKRIFNITQRSKGFQWFFNFIIKLKFNPRYKGEVENSIFLLDEPGSYLHSSAQKELLKELQKVSQTNTLIYCTHSHYLLDPRVIKLGSIRIAGKEKAKISLTNYGDYKLKNENGALSPIYQALQLNIANDYIGKISIFEGMTDFYFFSLIKKYSDFIPSSITLIPGTGAGSSTTMISLGLSFADKFIVIFDDDSGGKDAIKKYKKEFGPQIENHFHKYGNGTNKQLEDLISKSDAEFLLKNTGCNSIKKSFGIFFYDKSELHETFVKNLSHETIENCRPTFESLNNL